MRCFLARLFLGVFGFGLFLLAGCGSKGSDLPAPTTPVTPLSDVDIFGTVYGDQQVIEGAHVYLFAANTTGYGNASVSLLSEAETGASDSVGAYVATSTNGTFTLKGDYTCSSGQQLYLYVLGGVVNLASNPASGLLAAIGSCPTGSSGSGIAVTANEASTIAAAYALAGFATDATHVSSSGTALAKTGIANAFTTAGALVGLSTGVVPATTQAGNVAVPQTGIDTLADVLAGCISSVASCPTLFSTATSNGSPAGTVPTDTATAAINIAHNPGANVASLYAMSASIAFEPKLNKAPNDYTLALSITGGGLNGPYAVAIDASGNAWIANAAFFGATGGSGGVVEISSYGAFLSGVAGFANAAIVYPDGLAVDDSGNVWLASTSGGFNNEISDLGAQLPGPHGYSSLASSSNVAIDGSGNAWFAGGAIREYSSSGANVSANPYSGGGLTTSNSIAIDGSGSAWIPNPAGTVTKLSSTGAPLSGASGYPAALCCGAAVGIAIDSSGDAWMTKLGVVELSNSGTILSGANGFTGGGLAVPNGIAIDGASKVWVTNNLGGADIAELSSSGAVLSPASGYINANMYAPAGLAIDGSGDIWVANQGVQNATSGNVMEFIGLAAPVITPIAAGLPSAPTANGSSNLGTRP